MTKRAKMEFYVGGYAMPGQAGILKCVFDGERVEAIDSNAELRNPSWVFAHPSMPLLYAVEELSPEGGLAVLAQMNGRLKVLTSVSTRGADPCHIAMSPNERFLLVSNYTGGSLAVFELDAYGFPSRMTAFVRHGMAPDRVGKGIPVRQEAPHVHFSLCDGRNVYVCDLGQDRVYVYGWDEDRGTLSEGGFIDFPEGSGPRHLAFDADGAHMYVLCELDATIHVFERGSAGWTRVQVVPMTPDDFTGYERFTWSLGAAIHFADVRTLCASTRGHDSVAVFAVEPDGRLGARTLLPSGGQTPRDFLAAGEWLIVANQDGGGIRLFRRDGAGYSAFGAAFEAVRPTCLCRADG